MGLIISTIFGQKSRQILMVGPSGAGKTSLLYRLKLGEFVPTNATIGYNVEIIDYKDISFTIRDLRSGHMTRICRDIFLKDTDAVIFVIDSNDLEDIEIRYLMELFPESILLILANKQDLPNSKTTTEITQTLKLDQLPNKKWYIQGTSAAQGTGLNEALDWLSKELSGV